MITNIETMIEEQIAALSALRTTLQKSLARAPQGRLYSFRCHGSMEYQFVGEDKQRKYLTKKNDRLIRGLMQKSYDSKLMKLVDRQLICLNKIRGRVDYDELVRLYTSLPAEWKDRINGREISDEEFARNWQAEEYVRKPIDEDKYSFVSDRGERVRSKSEKIIADLLNKKGLSYRYEEEVYLRGLGHVHPDFNILHPRRRVGVFLEHCGMMDSQSYTEDAMRKINAYTKNGYVFGDRLLLTFESSDSPLDTEMLDKLIDQFFFG